MSEVVDRNTKFISKLVEVSQRGKIEWRPHRDGGYTSTVFGRNIRVLNVERQIPNWAASIVPGQPGKTSLIPVLEVLDDEGKVGFTFENVSGLRDLVYLASYHGARVNDFIEQVLAS